MSSTLPSYNHPEPNDTAIELTEEELNRNRTVMTILHFQLTYSRWSLALFVMLANATLFLPTAQDAIWQPIQDVRVVVREESQQHYECTAHAFAAVEKQLNKTLKQEYNRISIIDANNTKTIRWYQNLSSQCLNASVLSRRALQTWRLERPIPVYNDTSICTEQDRYNLTNWLGQDNRLVENQVAGAVEGYVDSSRSTSNLLLDYAQSRAAYDYDYFVAIKIQSVLSLLGNAELPELPSPDLDGIIEPLRDNLKAILAALQDSYVRINLLTVRITEFHASLQSFYVNYLELYNRLALSANFVRDFLPTSIPLPSFLDLSGFPTAELLLPPIFELPDFSGVLPKIEDLVLDYVRQAVSLVADLLAARTRQLSDEVREALEELQEKLRNALTLEDYDPPGFIGSHSSITSPEQEAGFLFQLGEVTKRNAEKALKQIQELGQQDFGELPSFPDVDFTGPSIESNSTTFFYLEPEFPSISYPEFIALFTTWVFGYQWLIEIVVQFIRIWRLKKRYERDAMPDLPEIDYRDDDEGDEEKGTKSQSMLSTLVTIQRAFGKHLLTPWIAAGVIVAPLAIIALTLWFYHVKANCIDSYNGTILTHNVWAPLAINHANLAGNALHSDLELQCRKTQRHVCHRSFAESDVLHRGHEQSLYMAERQFQESWTVSNILGRCINISLLDNRFEEACCGLEGYVTEECPANQPIQFCPIDKQAMPTAASFRPIGEYLAEPACLSLLGKGTNWTLQDARFDCNVLQSSCSAKSCSGGVDAEKILSAIIEADCQMSTYVMQSCLLLLIVLYHAVAINLALAMVFDGFKQLRWRYLRPDGIQLRTQVTPDGTLVKGGDLVERSARISAAMKRFERFGWIQLTTGAVLFVIWFITFWILRWALQDLVFKN